VDVSDDEGGAAQSGDDDESAEEEDGSADEDGESCDEDDGAESDEDGSDEESAEESEEDGDVCSPLYLLDFFSPARCLDNNRGKDQESCRGFRYEDLYGRRFQSNQCCANQKASDNRFEKSKEKDAG